MRLHDKSRTPKHIHLEVMVIESDLDVACNIPEGGHARGGMEEQLHLGKFITSQKCCV